MKSDTYHHGNLKEELIENGLKYIDKYGTETFSMRKLADSIGVLQLHMHILKTERHFYQKYVPI